MANKSINYERRNKVLVVLRDDLLAVQQRETATSLRIVDLLNDWNETRT